MAGLRTNVLVAVGACAFEMLGVFFTGIHGTDPSRIAAYVVSGIGFLGAGVIISDGVKVRGVNTAATIWCASAVGVLCGAGYIYEALVVALSVVAINVGLRHVARRIDRSAVSTEDEVQVTYTFRTTCRREDEPLVRGLITQSFLGGDLTMMGLTSRRNRSQKELVDVEAVLLREGRSDSQLEQAVSRLSLESSVVDVGWTASEPDDSDDEV
jgi:putative Mg2+ transporter-C (MgtC) family protein